jgi:thiamine transport system substrate-binding protein
MRSLIPALILALASPAIAGDKPVLTVMTYDSFASEWGPGPAIEKGFEATCGCDVRWQTAGDGAALLSRLKLEGAKTKADVVVGLDTSLTEAAAQSGLFARHGIDLPGSALPVAWTDPTFLPFDWGYFAFVYDKTKVKAPPASFTELAKSKLKIVIEDPRSSTPGLGLLYWVKAAYGDKAGEIWKSLADNIVTVTPGWTEAYNMFLAGEADMVLSYTTSPAYHLIAENDDSKAAAAFTEGNYLEVEVAGKIASSFHPELADAFLRYLVGPEAQAAIPTMNWMYPAVTPPGGLPKGFETLTVPEKALLLSPADAASLRDKAVEEWRAALSQ